MPEPAGPRGVDPDALAAQAVAGCEHVWCTRMPAYPKGACQTCLAAAIRAGIAGALTVPDIEAGLLYALASGDTQCSPDCFGKHVEDDRAVDIAAARAFLAALRARAGVTD